MINEMNYFKTVVAQPAHACQANKPLACLLLLVFKGRTDKRQTFEQFSFQYFNKLWSKVARLN